MTENQDGLYSMYRVEKDGEPIEDCFVLEPADDPAAREALRTYADETNNEALATDLRKWADSSESEVNPDR